jgi:hypothetical protein
MVCIQNKNTKQFYYDQKGNFLIKKEGKINGIN